MQFPDEFYYHSATSQLNYQEHPIGRPDFRRICQKYPDYWISPNLHIERQQRTLIFADWNQKNWLSAEKHILKQGLNLLRQHQFKLYLWQTTSIVQLDEPLQKQLFDELNNDIQQHMLLTNLEDIYHIASKQGLKRDETFVIDSYWLAKLFIPNLEKSLSLDDFMTMELSEDLGYLMHQIIPALKDSHPKVNQLIMDIDAIDSEIYANKLQSIFPQLEWVQFPFRSCIINSENIEVFSKKISQQPEVYHQVRKLQLSDLEISAEQFFDWISLMPQLEILTIINCQQTHLEVFKVNTLLTKLRKFEIRNSLPYSFPLATSIILSSPMLELLILHEQDIKPVQLVDKLMLHLRYLSLTGCSFDVPQLHQLLSSTPHLEHLILNNRHDPLNIKQVFQGLDCQHLKVIDLRYCYFTGQLTHLLSVCPQLECLYLGPYQNETDVESEQVITLPHLKQLTLEQEYDYSHDVLKPLLAAAPNLENIQHLSSMEGFAILLESPCLAHLKRLGLSNLHFDAEQLSLLLQNVSQLKHLSLTNCSMRDDLKISESHRLITESLVLCNCNFTTHNTYHLFAIMPNLSSLYLENNEFPFGIWHDLARIPSRLEYLYLDQIEIESFNLQQLLQVNPHLKKLTLSHTILTCFQPFQELPLRLSQLKYLEVRYSQLPIVFLLNILNQTEQLETLHLLSKTNDALSFFTSNFFTHLKKLSNLKQFHLSNAHINGFELELLLCATPYIETLELNGCSNISNGIKLDDSCLPLLKNLNLYQTDLSPKDLKRFKRAAPHLVEIHQKLDIEDECQHPEQQVLDAETKADHEIVFDLQQIFYPVGHDHIPSFSDYRLQIFDLAVINQKPCSIHDAFTLIRTQDFSTHITPVQVPQPKRLLSLHHLDLTCFLTPSICDALHIDYTESAKTSFQQQGQFYFANTFFQIDNSWRPLPSLSAFETLIAISCHPYLKLDIAYSPNYNQYLVKAAASQTVEMNYLIYIQQLPQAASSFQSITQNLLSFQEGALEILSPNPSGIDYMLALLQQKKGACRHRAIALKIFLQSLPQAFSRIINNDCHSFVEVLEPHYPFWQRYDLGGYPAIFPKIQATIQESPTNPFLATLATWDKACQAQSNLAEFIQHKSLKKLIEVSNESQAYQHIFAIAKFCIHQKIDIFIVHQACELLCAVASIDEHGQLQQAPSGPMYRFLQQIKTPAVILINYSHFKLPDYARFNSLLDSQRHIDQIEIPEHIQIIGVYHPSTPSHRPGSDFFSRFDNIQQFSIDNPTFTPISTYTGDEEETYTIALFHSHDWQAKLLGHWQLHQQGFVWKTGEIEQAIEQGAKHIILQNAPWDDPEFSYFWQQALYLEKIITTEYQLPLTNIHIHQANGYEWQKLIQVIKPLTTTAEYILNPQTLTNFLSHYHVDAQQKLCERPGFIYQKQQLAVLNTHSLNEHEWAMLLHECLTHQVTLAIAIAPNVQLPKQFPPLSTQQLPIDILISQDIDVSLIELEQQYPDAVVIDISECHDTDILGKIEVSLQDKSMLFTSAPSFPSLCLAQDKTLILKGQFNLILSQSLAPWFLAHAKNIILLSENTNHLHYLQAIVRPIHVEQKKTAFCQRHQLSAFPETLLTKLDCPLVSMQHRADALLHIQLQPAFESLLIETNHSLLTKQRIQLILDYLEHSPYVFLVGISGVGKTSLMQQMHFPGNIYKGETLISTWAKDPCLKPAFLFLDEANLSPSNWSMFEGLFHQKPALFYQGQHFPLTQHHKVIFAGNPLSYGDERKLATLFSRHGRMITLTPFPNSVIFETFISPLFPEPDIAQHLLQIYQFICQQSQHTLLISPREIQTICLLSFSYLQQPNPAANRQEVVHFFAYHISKSLLPESVLTCFEKQFPRPKDIYNSAQVTDCLTSYFLTPSRQYFSFMLQQWLYLRLLRKRLDHTHPLHNLPGLGGVILEGESGIGKSELLRSICRVPQDVTHISVSMDQQEKECRLKDAFHQGQIVIMDEINCSPMMERLLNALLMGKTPEGEPALKPGFLLIGTQNPISYSGRCAPSQALARRLLKMELMHYPEHEIKQILIKKGLDDSCATQLTQAFHQQSLFAKSNRLQPAPNFRDVIRCAEQHLKTIVENPKH
jgi:hypothetical protein